MRIFFILGPSGSGKTTLAAWVGTDLNLLHIEVDRYPDGNGIDLARLRKEWDAFWEHADPRPLVAELRNRAHSAGVSGAVLSFPSGVVPSPVQLETATASGICVVVLYGSGAECVDAFLRREQASGRLLGADHWIANNAQSYAAFSLPIFSAHRLGMFRGGFFRTRAELVAEVVRHAG